MDKKKQHLSAHPATGRNGLIHTGFYRSECRLVTVHGCWLYSSRLKKDKKQKRINEGAGSGESREEQN
ncbi:MAG: hypothetical protein JRE23_16845 [Deltaproteobacteria bacterium]|nr:hypothetical protein [Deltaproteobacteria bacterium]